MCLWNRVQSSFRKLSSTIVTYVYQASSSASSGDTSTDLEDPELPVTSASTQEGNNPDSTNPDSENCERIPCKDSNVTICINRHCDTIQDCPSGDDEINCLYSAGNETFQNANQTCRLFVCEKCLLREI